MSDFELQVGKRYVCENRHVTRPLRERGELFLDDSGLFGKFFTKHGEPTEKFNADHGYRIVSEYVEPPAPAEPEFAPEAANVAIFTDATITACAPVSGTYGAIVDFDPDSEQPTPMLRWVKPGHEAPELQQKFVGRRGGQGFEEWRPVPTVMKADG